MLLTSKILVVLWVLVYIVVPIRMAHNLKHPKDSITTEDIEKKLEQWLRRHDKTVMTKKDLNIMKVLFFAKTMGLMGLMMVPFVVTIVIHNTVAPSGYHVLEYNEQAIMLLPLLFVMIGVMGLIIYPIRRQKIVLSLYVTVENNQNFIDEFRRHLSNFDRKIIHKLAFWVFLIGMPFYIIGLFSYGYYNDERLIYRGYLSVKEEVYVYDELVSVDRGFFDRFGKTQRDYYRIKNDKGQTYEMINGGNYSQVLYIHERIESVKPELMIPVTLTARNILYIEKKSVPNQAQIYDIMD